MCKNIQSTYNIYLHQVNLPSPQLFFFPYSCWQKTVFFCSFQNFLALKTVDTLFLRKVKKLKPQVPENIFYLSKICTWWHKC